MDRVEIGVVGIITVLVLIALRMQVGVALGLVAFVGTVWLTNLTAAFGILSTVPHNFVAQWSLSAVPMFLLMGYIASRGGLTTGLFTSARILVGRVPGGLASATVIASALFASASGSSIATSAAFSKIAVPEMLKANYKPSLATGSVAAAGTLGSMIPPSILMIIYGIFTGTSIGDLFMAGVIPGLLTAVMYIMMITVRTWLNPALGPISNRVYSRAEFWVAIRDIWPLPILILGVMGGIFTGVFTPTESGAVGAVLAILIAIARGSMSRKALIEALIDTAEGTSTVLLIAVGAVMFSVFLGLTTLPMVLADYMLSVVDSPLAVIAVIAVLYIILGMFVESTAIMLLTIPVFMPILEGLDINMVWFGILTIKLLEIGMITPPVGMNCFVIKSALGSSVSLSQVFRGASWFVLTDVVTLTIIVLFPALALYLPALMR
ncbi:TRAP transporter large permease [Mesorhizobium sp. A556]